MIPPSLPAELQAALSVRLEGLSRNDAATHAARISRIYRDGGGSDGIRSDIDALAYALARMPATYAAMAAALNALCEVKPNFAPQSLLDIGAGPGTASWAAAEAFSSLTSFALLDNNDALRALALDLMRGGFRFDGPDYRKGDAGALLAAAEPADLVIAGYMIGELRERERTELVASAWDRTRDTLLIVEPGTPKGYERIIALRKQLIAQGAHVAAPCPHDRDCPLTPTDWCHFAQRLPRSRAHKQIKNAELPFEDEKFAYVALTRAPVTPRPPRILAPPAVTKIEVVTKLCTTEGLVFATAPRRDKSAYSDARKRRWGETANGNTTSNL